MKIFLIILITFGVFYDVPDAKANVVSTYQELREFEKISITLTGYPLSNDQRAKVLSGELTKQALIDASLRTEDFVRKFGQFWAKKLGIVDAKNGGILNIKRGASNTMLGRDLEGFQSQYNLPSKNQRTQKQLQDRINQIKNRNRTIRLYIRECGNELWLVHRIINLGEFNKVINTKKYVNGDDLIAPLEKYRELRGLSYQIDPRCNQANNVKPVKPYWDPNGINVWKTTAYAMDPKRCGADLSKCFINNNRSDWRRGISEDSNLEPGYIIGQTVADGASFSQILTTSKTIMTERYANFFKNRFTWWDNFPDKKYTENKEPRWSTPSLENDELFWIERGEKHAGVLTTFNFQYLTNGRRAKANRAYEAFMCSKFVVPEGAVPKPDDTNPDLTKRAYCAYCHRTLEPMASFFNRWPVLGRVNYEYNANSEVNDYGFFDGKEGNGVKRFGEIMSQTRQFKKCSIKRSFEFVFGRELTSPEAASLMPNWLSIYKDSGEDLGKVISDMLQNKLFHESVEGTQENAEGEDQDA